VQRERGVVAAARLALGYHDGVHVSASMRVSAIAMIASLTASCGSGTPTSPVPSGASHVVIATVMLESTGPSPREITIGVGETVSFMNHDEVPYTVAGGAGPSQPACSEVNAVGVLGPYEIRRTAPFATAKTCDYHVPRGSAILFSGRIVIR
jgi:plastocyanin